MTAKEFVLSFYPETEVETNRPGVGRSYWFVDTDPNSRRMGAFCGYSSICENEAWEITKNQILRKMEMDLES